VLPACRPEEIRKTQFKNGSYCIAMRSPIASRRTLSRGPEDLNGNAPKAKSSGEKSSTFKLAYLFIPATNLPLHIIKRGFSQRRSLLLEFGMVFREGLRHGQRTAGVAALRVDAESKRRPLLLDAKIRQIILRNKNTY
jgi:hypothetical protein